MFILSRLSKRWKSLRAHSSIGDSRLSGPESVAGSEKPRFYDIFRALPGPRFTPEPDEPFSFGDHQTLGRDMTYALAIP